MQWIVWVPYGVFLIAAIVIWYKVFSNYEEYKYKLEEFKLLARIDDQGLLNREICGHILRKERYLRWYCKYRKITEQTFWKQWEKERVSTEGLRDCLIKRYLKYNCLTIEEKLTHPDKRIRELGYPFKSK